jgi:hypothetical protein
VSISEDKWAIYSAAPDSVDVFSPSGERVFTLEKLGGYPFFMSKRNFVINSGQYSVREYGPDGDLLWNYDFSAPITCVNASNDLFAVGLLSGVFEVLDKHGSKLYSFEPGGSRLPVILGCAVSATGERAALLCGIDKLRFILLERFSGSYRVVYHEFLNDDFRRPCLTGFLDDGRHVFFERDNGLSILNAETRQVKNFPLEGRLLSVSGDSSEGRVFVMCETPAGRKKLAGISLDDYVLFKTTWASRGSFLKRQGDELYIGSDKAVAAFAIDTR